MKAKSLSRRDFKQVIRTMIAFLDFILTDEERAELIQSWCRSCGRRWKTCLCQTER